MQGSRPARIGEEIRMELADLLQREVHDPGIGFVTVTHVKVSADLQVARAYYTTLGDETARKSTAKALERAKPFLRRRVAARIGLRRAPELAFQYDESIAREERIESLLQEIRQTPTSPDEEGLAAPKSPPGDGPGLVAPTSPTGDEGGLDREE
jgi:ribosome-binding factor A